VTYLEEMLDTSCHDERAYATNQLLLPSHHVVRGQYDCGSGMTVSSPPKLGHMLVFVCVGSSLQGRTKVMSVPYPKLARNNRPD
jgi:hypothetical protein